MERVIVAGDLSKLTPADRTRYYNAVCQSVGLNPFTRPFEYITLNNKLTLYARKDCTDQLRKINNVSVQIVGREKSEDVYIVTARATTHDGRTDESIGAVSIKGLSGDALCNAMMKAETKARRRVTLSICGLGFLDESETETIPGARLVNERSLSAAPPAAAEPSPERGQLVEEVEQICAAMNHAGHTPRWSKALLNAYVNETLMTTGGFDGLDIDRLRELKGHLSQKLDALIAANEAGQQGVGDSTGGQDDNDIPF
ncbi:MAG TPA: hypothetical protein VF735_09000 [Pyrinomonadaceae bacterium]